MRIINGYIFDEIIKKKTDSGGVFPAGHFPPKSEGSDRRRASNMTPYDTPKRGAEWSYPLVNIQKAMENGH